jgi:hypothetical protein
MGSAPQLSTFYDRLLLFSSHNYSVGAPVNKDLRTLLCVPAPNIIHEEMCHTKISFGLANSHNFGHVAR